LLISLKKKIPPDELKATLEFQMFYKNLKENSATYKQITACLDILRQDLAVGEKIERAKFPEVYLRRYGITNLYRLAVGRGSRLLYTVIAQGSKKVVCVLEYFPSHKDYDKRFGYSS
jgi:hypothetical protein